MWLERVATSTDRLSVDLLGLQNTLLDLPPAGYVTRLCAVLGRLQAVSAEIPLDDRNRNGSILCSRERLRTTLPLHLEAVRLLGNRLALTPPTADTDGVLEWLTTHRTRLYAASVLVALEPANEVPQ